MTPKCDIPELEAYFSLTLKSLQELEKLKAQIVKRPFACFEPGSHTTGTKHDVCLQYVFLSKPPYPGNKPKCPNHGETMIRLGNIYETPDGKLYRINN